MKLVSYTAFFTILILILLSRAVMAGISHDEYQFVAGGQLFREKGLLPYIHYLFLHMPYMPVINGLVLHLSHNDFLSARLFNELVIFVSILLLFSLLLRLLENSNPVFQTGAGFLSVLLFITDPSLVIMDGRALNHSIPILLSVSTLWVYSRPLKKLSISISLFICGLLVGAAAGFRINYVVLAAPILLAIGFDPIFTDRKEKIRGFTAFCAGLIGALAPAGILFLMAPKPFIYGNFHYIALNTIYRENLGYNISMNLPDKFWFFYQRVLSSPTDLLLYIGFLALLIAIWTLWKRTGERDVFLIILVYAIALILLMSGFAPTPLWPQYFFGPVPFLIVGLFWGLSVVLKSRQALLSLSLIPVFAAFLINLPISTVASQLKGLSSPGQWTTTKFEQLGEDIRISSGCASKCKILTLVPVLPMEAGLEIYPMFAAGPFSWRTAPILSKERREEYRIISYDDISEFLNNDPPDAILTGTEAHFDGFTKYDPGGLDQPFVDYAVNNDYHPVEVESKLLEQDLLLTLWVKEEP